MARALNWQFNVNVAMAAQVSVPNQKALWLWTFIRFLTGNDGVAASGLWVVEGSGNGTTGAMDGVDRWQLNGAFNPALIQYSAGVNSWICLSAPVGMGPAAYVVIYPGDATSGVQYRWTMTKPTTNGNTVPNMVSATGAFTTGLPEVATAVASRAHMALSTRGDWWVGYSRNSTAYVQHVVIFSKCTPAWEIDAWPYAFLRSNGGGSGGSGTTGPAAMSSGTSIFNSSAGTSYVLGVDGTTNSTCSGSTFGYQASGSLSTINNNAGKRLSVPFFAWVNASAGSSPARILPTDFAIHPNYGATDGILTPADANNAEFVLVGQLWLPWPGGGVIPNF